MSLEQYDLKSDEIFMSFEFISEGPKGRIVKLIQFTRFGEDEIYNLAFGDKNIETEDINDAIITDNKDREKVLATVVASIFTFTTWYPHAWVFIEGSTDSRTRLYQIAISIYFEELTTHFHIFGYFDNKWIEFKKNQNYTAFLIKKKS